MDGRRRPDEAFAESYAHVDWSSTVLGPRASWTPTLESALRLVLETRFPAVLMWGPEHAMLYNEAYVVMIGDKHPAALGAPAPQVFAEAWEQLQPHIDSASVPGGATWSEDELVPLVRHGFLEERHFTFSYSPVLNPAGEVEGVLDIAHDTSNDVVVRRRLATLARLAETLGQAETVAEWRKLSLDALLQDEVDLRGVDLVRSSAPEAPDTDVAALVAEARGSAAPTRSLGTDPATTPIAHEVEAAIAARSEGLYVEERPGGAIVWQAVDSDESEAADRWLLACTISDRLALDDEFRFFLRLVAHALTQALDRIRFLEVERLVASSEREMSLALQHSALMPPTTVPGIDVCARYLPAADDAQIGGDWYDAFVQSDGSLALSIGDIAGHDRAAAVAMAQVRNLARGIAAAITRGTDNSPARVLELVDETMSAVPDAPTATALFARVDPDPQDPTNRPTGVLRWSRAGHPPPLHVDAGGAVAVLDDGGDLLLGVSPDTSRTEMQTRLRPGDTLVLYTDGLVERRGVPLDVSTQELVDAIAGAHRMTPEQICDRLLASIAPGHDDDTAVLVLRVRPEVVVPAES